MRQAGDLRNPFGRIVGEKLLHPLLGVLVDLQGPKLRIGAFSDGPIELCAGERFRLDLETAIGDRNRVPLLLALEAMGYQVSSVSRYVQAISETVPKADPPPLLDGTWQPNSTDGMRRWLGGSGLWAPNERDNDG